MHHAEALCTGGATAGIGIGHPNAGRRMTASQQATDQGTAHIAAADESKQRIHRVLS